MKIDASIITSATVVARDAIRGVLAAVLSGIASFPVMNTL
jgi:hypothetical protein